MGNPNVVSCFDLKCPIMTGHYRTLPDITGHNGDGDLEMGIL